MKHITYVNRGFVVSSVFQYTHSKECVKCPGGQIWQSRFSQKEEFCEFDSRPGYHAKIAHQVEHRSEEPGVVGSSPTLGTKFIGVWCNGNTTDFDSVVLGSSPGTSAK